MNLLLKFFLAVVVCSSISVVCSSISVVGYLGLSDDSCDEDCEAVVGNQHEKLLSPQNNVARFAAETARDQVPEPNAEYLEPPHALQQPLTSAKIQSGFGSWWSRIKQSVKFSAPDEASLGNKSHDHNQNPNEVDLEVAEGGIEGTGISDDDPFGLSQGGDEDGIEGTGLSSDEEIQIVAIGPITQFGSIYVNGIKYETDEAEVIFANSAGSGELSVGMTVQVHAEWDEEQQAINASKVVFDQQISGPVSALSSSEEELLLTILGATVVVDENTVIDGVDWEDVRKGQVFAVSGLEDNRERLIATYMGLQTKTNHSSISEVEGRVRRVKSNAMRIELRDLTIDASQAQFLEGTIEDLSKNDLIEVLGVYDSRQKVLAAASIRIKDLTENVGKGSKLSIDGVIGEFYSLSRFNLNGFNADASNAELTGGTPLAEGVRIKANGFINDAGVFEIRNARVVARAKYTVKAPVDMLLPSINQITVLGITAVTDEDTLFASKLDFPDKYQSLDSIVEGDWVQLKGNYYGGRLSLNSITTLKQQKKQSIKGIVSVSKTDRVEVMGLVLEAKTASVEKQLMNLEAGQLISAKGYLKAEGSFLVEKLGVKSRR